LPAKLVDLLNLRFANQQPRLLVDIHARDLTKKGVPLKKLALVQAWEQAATSSARRARRPGLGRDSDAYGSGVPDDVYQITRAVFSEKELVDLTIAIGPMNAYNRMAISFGNAPRAAIIKIK
jgi:alkylhydroperoxidase family enzyme